MKLKSVLTIVITFIAVSAFALSPRPEFTVKNKFGGITSFEVSGVDVEINGMSSEFSFEDLTDKDLKALKDHMKTKQEYGKVFGFNEWKATGQKLVEKNGERIVLIQGTYKNAKNSNVNFIEVYWATKQKSGQYLITSDSLKLQMDQYSEYLR